MWFHSHEDIAKSPKSLESTQTTREGDSFINLKPSAGGTGVGGNLKAAYW